MGDGVGTVDAKGYFVVPVRVLVAFLGLMIAVPGRIVVALMRQLQGFLGGEARFAELLGILEEIGRQGERAWTRLVIWGLSGWKVSFWFAGPRVAGANH